MEHGARFGRLVVVEQAQERVRGYVAFRCTCDCGASIVVPGSQLRRGEVVSCGCAKRERAGAMNRKHGARHTKAFGVWWNMKSRCERPNGRYYKDYGGRGIKVCDRWQEFVNFLADMGQPEPGQRIERLDNDGNYEPGNCVWIDAQAQANNRRSNRMLTHAGKTMTVAEWGRETGFGAPVLLARLNVYGWTVDRALTEPVHR